MPDTALIYFIPCCAPGDNTIIFRGAPIAGITNNSYWVYTTAIIGQGTAPWDSLIPGQCYNIFFGSTPGISTAPILTLTVSSFSNSAAYFQTDQTCTAPYCVNICNNLPPQEFTNRYYKFTPCCDPTNPVYFKPVTLGTQIATGVAIYSATITPNPYPTTDIFGNPDNPLIANFCYSITLENAGPGMHVTNATEWNNLQEAPNNASSNFLYVSQGTSCTAPQVISSCPSCNPFCFTLWSCDGSQPLFTTYTDLTAYIGTNILVSSLDPDDNIVDVCVFVQDSTGSNCTNAIEVIVESETCECDCTCYTILGVIKSVEWIDCDGIYHLAATPQSPFQICAGAYPLTYPSIPDNPLQIIDNGLCIESTIFNDETCEEETVFNCEPPCYLLEDCLDNTNVIYSNSPSLLGPANLGQVVTIAGYTECWKVLIPQICDCPINVTVLTVSECCEACLPNINYKLTTCNDSNVYVYTSDDLSLYVDKVIRREDCPEECWIVSQIDGNIPTDTPIVVLEDYLDCEVCYRKYYLLEDCLGLQNDIITYTDLSDYVDKVITLDWCPETCWEVTETIVDNNAGIISDILNTYNVCIDCLTNASCICSTIKNYNTISQIYKYLDCYGILQSITLLPNQKSNRLCLIRWYAPEPCDELIVTITSSTGIVSSITVYQNSINHPGPVIVNDKPTWKDAGNTLYIYYNGTKWILSKNLTPLVLPSVYTTIGFINCNGDCDCPTGTWQQSSSIPNQDVYVTTELKYTIEYFGNCINGVCPARKNNQKSITPGYNTPGCEAWKYEEISCRSAEAMYKQVLELRYGISNCCPEEDEQYIVQKELIDLAALHDPAYPCSTNSCGCNNNCNCSTAEPVCPVIPLTYNCFCTHTGCECIERGDGSGEYSTLALCQTSCVQIPVTYNCVNNNCTDPGDGLGEYLTLEACEEECQPVTTYNCNNGSCVPVSGPLGQFSTLQQCQSNCQPITSYNCVNGNCVLVSGSGGNFPTLLACEEDCELPPICSVLTNDPNGNIYEYFPSSNTNVFLGNYPISSDIAHTATKLWLVTTGGSDLREYDITLSPWSATFNRSICNSNPCFTFPQNYVLGVGLSAITNTQLISTNSLVSPEEIIVLDITTNFGVPTVIGTLGANRLVSGDILLTTTNKILVTNFSTAGSTLGNMYLTQYSYPSGTFEVEVDITSTGSGPFGLFIDNGNIYVCQNNGNIYNIDVNFPYTQTLFNNSGLNIGGASSLPSCNNANLII